MKTVIFLIVALMSISVVTAQQQFSLERSISGVQLEVFGVRAYHEIRLSNRITLRAEAGLVTDDTWLPRYSAVTAPSFEESVFVLVPVVSVQPRIYFDLFNRGARGRKVENNAVDFFAFCITFAPDWVLASSGEGSYTGGISFVSTWGIRRNLGRNFEYELGVGSGYAFGFDGSNGVVFRPHLRIGYRF